MIIESDPEQEEDGDFQVSKELGDPEESEELEELVERAKQAVRRKSKGKEKATTISTDTGSPIPREPRSQVQTQAQPAPQPTTSTSQPTMKANEPISEIRKIRSKTLMTSLGNFLNNE